MVEDNNPHLRALLRLRLRTSGPLNESDYKKNKSAKVDEDYLKQLLDGYY